MARLTKYQRWSRANYVQRLVFDTTALGHDEALREIEQAVNIAGILTVRYWKTDISPEHFERPAHAAYGYADRKLYYIRWKFRRFPASRGLDLILTGNLKAMAAGPPKYKPSGRKVMNGFVFKIVLRTPDYVRKNRYIDLHGELVTKNRQDTIRLAVFFRKIVWLAIKGQLPPEI